MEAESCHPRKMRLPILAFVGLLFLVLLITDFCECPLCAVVGVTKAAVHLYCSWDLPCEEVSKSSQSIRLPISA